MTTAKKSSSRKAPTTAKRTQAEQRTRIAATALAASLPAGFFAEGFETRGDEVRVWGKVRSNIGADAAQPAPMSAQSYPSPPAPSPASTRTSPLVEALMDHRMQIEDVFAAIESLETAISFVTIPQPPAGETGSGKNEPLPVQSAAIDQVQGQTRLLAQLAGRIRYVTDRVQA